MDGIKFYKLDENDYINLNMITRVVWDKPLSGNIYLVIHYPDGERHFDRPEAEINKILKDIGINL